MNTQNVWVKRSEREPTEADLPIVMGGYMCGSGKVWDIALYSCLPPKSHWSGYWRSIKAEPPPRELTQREMDEAACKAAHDLAFQKHGIEGLTARQAALEAIYSERREVFKLFTKTYETEDWGKGSGYADSTRQLRARLDEQGAK